MFKLSFRNLLAASAVVAGTSILVAPTAHAANDSGTVSGTVAPITTVDYTQPATAATLDPTNGNTNVDFGSVLIQCNSNNGWTLSVASSGSGVLTDAVSSQTITYNGFEASRGTPIALDVSGGSATIEDVAALTCADSTGCTYALTADFANTEIDGKPAGSYSDTLTFTLMAK